MGAKTAYRVLGRFAVQPYGVLTGQVNLRPLGGRVELAVKAARAGGGRYQHGATGVPTYSIFAVTDTDTAIGALWLKSGGVGRVYMSGYIHTAIGKILLTLFKSDVSGERDTVWLIKGGLPPVDESPTDSPHDRPF